MISLILITIMNFAHINLAHADWKSDIETGLRSYSNELKNCGSKVSSIADQTACAKQASSGANAYMLKLLAAWQPKLRSGPRGELAYGHHIESQTHWVDYRREFCTFVGLYAGGERTELERELCHLITTQQRVREIFILQK